jgi:hypothetical protein
VTLFDEFLCKLGFFVQLTDIRVEYNVFLFDEPLKGSKSLKFFYYLYLKKNRLASRCKPFNRSPKRKEYISYCRGGRGRTIPELQDFAAKVYLHNSTFSEKKTVGYQAKKSKVLIQDKISLFLEKTNDKNDLLWKVNVRFCYDKLYHLPLFRSF